MQAKKDKNFSEAGKMEIEPPITTPLHKSHYDADGHNACCAKQAAAELADGVPGAYQPLAYIDAKVHLQPNHLEFLRKHYAPLSDDDLPTVLASLALAQLNILIYRRAVEDNPALAPANNLETARRLHNEALQELQRVRLELETLRANLRETEPAQGGS